MSESRPPEGDWLGTPFLRFERRGSIAIVTVDRPHRRNAMTPAMYFGVRYAVDHVNRSDELAACVLTGTGDVFIPGGDLGGDQEDAWGDLATLLHMDSVPFDALRHSAKPVVSAVNGICQGGGLMIAIFQIPNKFYEKDGNIVDMIGDDWGPKWSGALKEAA